MLAHGYVFHFAFCVIIVDSESTVVDVLCKLCPIVQTVEQRFAERAFRLGDCILFLKPFVKSLKNWHRFLLSHDLQFVAGNFQFFGSALDFVERLKHEQCLIAARFVVEQSLDEISTRMGEAGHEHCTYSCADGDISRKAIALEQAFPPLRKSRGHRGLCWSVMEKIDRMFRVAKKCPLSTYFDVFFFTAIQHFDWSVVGGNHLGLKEYRVHESVERRENTCHLSIEVTECGATKLSIAASVNGALTVKREVVEVSRHDNLGEESRSSKTIFDCFGNAGDETFRLRTIGTLILDRVKLFNVEACRDKFVATILQISLVGTRTVPQQRQGKSESAGGGATTALSEVPMETDFVCDQSSFS